MLAHGTRAARIRATALCLLIPATIAFGQSPPRNAPPPSTVRALFVAHCATCHGEKGDGQGVTDVGRAARSFLDGGFAYGNTPDAVMRSITHGIPGTPMPAFQKALREEQRRELAEYVIALGPEVLRVDAAETEMVVRDRPRVVRGKLPPVVPGAPTWPRGLIAGTTDGLSLEYRADDVRLLAVRAGRFVNRRDWTGRGGDALEPLGQPVLVLGQGDPGPTFEREGPTEGTWVPVPARLTLTLTSPKVLNIQSSLRESGAAGAPEVATVGESIFPRATTQGTVIHRRIGVTSALLVDGAARGFRFRVRCFQAPGLKLLEESSGWIVVQHGDGRYLAITRNLPPTAEGLSVEGDTVWWTCDGRPQRASADCLFLPLAAWDDGTRSGLAQVGVR